MVGLLWVIYGYSMTFTNGGSLNPFVGGFSKAFLMGVAPDSTAATFSNGVVIPEFVYICFQMTFAMITPALIVGAFAERMKFSALIVFMVLWVTFVYFPIAHMVWYWAGPDAIAEAAKAVASAAEGAAKTAAQAKLDEVTADAGQIFQWGALDFAGGTVVHISSGASALVCALVLGKRSGFPNEPMPPHNVVYSLIGTGLLWVGWFGFNAGSAVGAGELATRAFAATHFSAAAAAMSWGFTEWFLKGRPSVLGVASGMVAGLATITPASGFVTIPSAMVIGLISGIVCYLAVTKLKAKFGYDDSLDVFGVHGVGSTIGMIACGLLASPEVNPLIASTFQINGTAVSLAGGFSQLKNQLIGIVVAAGLGAIATFILLKIIGAVVGLRVDEEAESIGIDLAEHGEKAYND
jgi:Amt family ammonium transporter